MTQYPQWRPIMKLTPRPVTFTETARLPVCHVAQFYENEVYTRPSLRTRESCVRLVLRAIIRCLFRHLVSSLCGVLLAGTGALLVSLVVPKEPGTPLLPPPGPLRYR